MSESPCPAGFAAPWVEVPHGRQALAVAARNFYRKPDERVAFTGVTGTNGKTTTAYLIDAMLRATGKTTAMIGTIEYRLAGERMPAPNTTPESLDVLRIAEDLVERGGSHLTMEVSSHALALGRVYGFAFHTAVFTNLTRDHLDFHGTMEDYAAAKRLLFQPQDGPAPQWIVLNADDPASDQMVGAARSSSHPESVTDKLREGSASALLLRTRAAPESFATASQNPPIFARKIFAPASKASRSMFFIEASASTSHRRSSGTSMFQTFSPPLELRSLRYSAGRSRARHRNLHGRPRSLRTHR